MHPDARGSGNDPLVPISGQIFRGAMTCVVLGGIITGTARQLHRSVNPGSGRLAGDKFGVPVRLEP